MKIRSEGLRESPPFRTVKNVEKAVLLVNFISTGIAKTDWISESHVVRSLYCSYDCAVSIVIEAEPTDLKLDLRTAFGPPADIIAGFDGILSVDAD